MVSPEAARLLEQTGTYLQIQAQFTQAFVHFERASDIHKLLAEPEPAITIASHIYLFRHYYYPGRVCSGRAAHQESIETFRADTWFSYHWPKPPV